MSRTSVRGSQVASQDPNSMLADPTARVLCIVLRGSPLNSFSEVKWFISLQKFLFTGPLLLYWNLATLMLLTCVLHIRKRKCLTGAGGGGATAISYEEMAHENWKFTLEIYILNNILYV